MSSDKSKVQTSLSDMGQGEPYLPLPASVHVSGEDLQPALPSLSIPDSHSPGGPPLAPSFLEGSEVRKDPRPPRP